MLKLVISDDEGKTTVVPLVRDEITIGRKEGNTIRLTERNVSRRHARLARRSGDYVLEDLASYNGIVINGARLLDARPLRHGDQILIGDYKLSIVEEATAQIQAPPSSPSSPPIEASGVHVAPPPSPLPPSVPPAPTPSVPPPPSGPGLIPPAAVPFPATTAAMPSATPSMPVPESIRGLRLVFLAPAGVPAPILLDRLPIILGRSEAADVALPFSSISREHARLYVEQGELWVEDLGSSNGVQINGEKVEKGALAPGDMVQLGVVEFRVARRGDSTVVIQKLAAEEKAQAQRNSLPMVGAILGAGAILGLAVFFAFRTPTPVPTVPSVPAPAPAVAESPTPPSAPAPVAPAAPAAVAPAPTAPAAPVAPLPAPAVVAPAVQPAAVPEPPPQAPLVVPPVPHTAESTPRPAARHATPPRPPVQAARPPAQAAHTNNASPAAPPSGGGGWEQARQCAPGPTRNQCVVGALAGHAQTMQELGMLAATYRAMGQRDSAVRTMRQYVSRFPTGPLATSFQQFINNP